MKITFLGTAAATSFPMAFCRCETCNLARSTGGKDHRKRSSVLVNQDLLIDLGPDVVTASLMYGTPLTDVRFCLQTHSHPDHFDATHLTTRVHEYMGVDTPPLKIFGSQATLEKMSQMLADAGYVSGLLSADDQQRLNMQVIPVQRFQSFQVGKYLVTAFQANHDDSVDSLIYSVEEDGFSVLYATDTDNLPEATWQAFHEKGMMFDVVILDHTYGPNAYSGGHLSAERVIQHIQRMKVEGLVQEGVRFFATHFSHEGNPVHEVLSAFAQQHGYEIAYDGLGL